MHVYPRGRLRNNVAAYPPSFPAASAAASSFAVKRVISKPRAKPKKVRARTDEVRLGVQRDHWQLQYGDDGGAGDGHHSGISY